MLLEQFGKVATMPDLRFAIKVDRYWRFLCCLFAMDMFQ